VSVSRHTSYNLIGAVIPIAISLVTVPIYLHLVGTDRYGVLAIAWLLLGYFGLFDLGLGRATSFRIAALKTATAEDRASTFWAALAVNAAMGLVGGAVLWAVATAFFGQVFKVDAALRAETLAAVPLLAASVPLATVSGVLSGAIQGRERFLEINMISVVSTALFQLLPLGIAWRFGPNLVWLLSASVGARLLSTTALGYFCYVEFVSGNPLRTNRAEVGVLLKYGGWVTFSAVFGPILNMLDRFVIGGLFGATAVTHYTVPVQLAGRTAIVSYALNSAIFPKLSAAEPREQSLLLENGLLSFAGLLSLPFLGAIYLIGPFFHIWVKQALGPEAPLIGRILVAAMWTNGLGSLALTKLAAAGRPDVVTRIQLIQIPLYLPLLYFGLHFMGITGAALAAAIRLVTESLVLVAVAGAPSRGKIVIIANFLVLMLGVWIAGLWQISDWRWWASASLLGSGMVALSLNTLPGSTRSQIYAMAVRLRDRR
jgi:O-antigen/teichoic acid export membrane protein